MIATDVLITLSPVISKLFEMTLAKLFSTHLPSDDLVFTCVSYAEARNRYRLDVCPSVRPSIRPSVRPPHAGSIVSKRLNILSCFLRHTIAHSF